MQNSISEQELARLILDIYEELICKEVLRSIWSENQKAGKMADIQFQDRLYCPLSNHAASDLCQDGLALR